MTETLYFEDVQTPEGTEITGHKNAYPECRSDIMQMPFRDQAGHQWMEGSDT